MNKFEGKVGRIFQVVAVLLVVTAGLKAQEQLPRESSSAAQMRALNNSVLQIHGRMQQSAGGESAHIRNEAAMVIAQRSAALAKLIQEDPHAALSFAFSPELLADLTAKFPDSATLLESHTTLSGPVEHWIMDSADMKSSKESWFISAGGSRLSLHFSTPQRPDPKAGPVVTIEGVQVGSDVAVSKVSSATIGGAAGLFSQFTNFFASPRSVPLVLLLVVFVLATSATLASRKVRLATSGWSGVGLLRQLAVCAVALLVVVSSPLSTSAQGTCSTTGVQNTAVLLVTYPGATLPTNVTATSMQAVFFGSSGRSLTGFWNEASYGQTSASGDVFTYNLSNSYTCTNIAQMRDDAISGLSATGVNFQNYSRIVMIFPDALGCGWSGMSTVGCTTISSPSGSFVASASYLDSYYLTGTTNQSVQLVTHELGHGLGLNHGRSRSFGTEALGPLGTNGSILEYGDGWTTMGFLNLGQYSAPHKTEQLGWTATNYQTVQSSGTYLLEPYETNPAGLKALKIQRGTGNNAWLWLEYRQPVGNYDPTVSPQVFTGALIHYEDSLTAALHTDLLNFTPSDTSFNSPALIVGQTWTDPYTNLSLSVLSATSSGLTVSVNYGAVPCTSSAPSVAVSPLNPSIYPGQTASYSATVTNNDSSACSSSTINLGSSEPSGWSTSLSSSSVTLSPGQSASVTMGKGAPSGTPAGTYAVNLNVSNNAATGASTANATVMTPPSLAVTVSVSGASFTRPGTVPISASVTNGGAPASGASVTFTVTASDGSTATQTATTGSNGTATWNYHLNAKSPTGSYIVSAQAALSSGSKKTASTQSTTSNTATFTVQ